MGWDEAKDPDNLDIPLTEALPKSEAGGQGHLFVQDLETQNLLCLVLKELRIMNLHLMKMTDETFSKVDVEV
jgi:hypothetical protein